MAATRIMTNNYLDPDVISNSYVSSEQAAFPISNAYNAQRRSKVWRSNGAWEVTLANNVINFRESIGVDIGATIDIGVYTSNTTFFAAVKAAFEDAGDSTYTVSSDATTKKIKIVSNGGGGGGIFEINWTTSTGAAELMGFLTTEDDSGSLTYIADSLKISTGEWVKWDMGISTNPMAFILIGPRNSPIKISPSATLKLQGNETDAWGDPSYETTLTYNDSSIVVMDEDGLHTEALRYWRLLIQDLANPLGYVEIGSIFLGDFFQATRGAVQFPFQANYIDRSETVFSEGGQTFSDIREKSEQFSLSWFGLTISEKEEIDAIFADVGTSTPFFISMDTGQAFSSSENYYIRYVKFESAPSYSLESPGNFACSMLLREEL